MCNYLKCHSHANNSLILFDAHMYGQCYTCFFFLSLFLSFFISFSFFLSFFVSASQTVSFRFVGVSSRQNSFDILFLFVYFTMNKYMNKKLITQKDKYMNTKYKKYINKLMIRTEFERYFRKLL